MLDLVQFKKLWSKLNIPKMEDSRVDGIFGC